MSTTTWLAIDPVDTLFFRGAESMEAGENHEVDTMFPPMPATITGAIRTAVLRQNGIAPADYLKNPATWQRQYPLLGIPNQPGFSLIGPLFLVDENLPCRRNLSQPPALRGNFCASAAGTWKRAFTNP